MGSGILGKFSGVAHIVETNWPSGPDRLTNVVEFPHRYLPGYQVDS